MNGLRVVWGQVGRFIRWRGRKVWHGGGERAVECR